MAASTNGGLSVAPSSPARQQIDPLAAIIQGSALPGEDSGFDAAASQAAAGFVIDVMAQRAPHQSKLALESAAGGSGQQPMRLAIVNDDMPFLVDSVCSAVTGFGLTIERLIHPVVSVRRDDAGHLTALSDQLDSGDPRESVIYLEIERTSAKRRRALETTLLSVLGDVAAAVGDWLKMQIVLGECADSLPGGEGAALLRWFLDRNLTLLAAERVTLAGERSDALGLSRRREDGLLSPSNVQRAFAWFARGGQAPLLIKSNRLSSVHRTMPMDLIVTPVREGETITALSIVGGLWTSAALAASPDKIPLLRSHLTAIFDKFGFAPNGHAGKALIHALTELPHDILIILPQAELETLALIAMSLIDRPRPRLHAVQSPLARHLFCFIWLPREQMSTQRRQAIEKLLTDAAGAQILSWSNSLNEGGLTLLRYTLDLGPDSRLPDSQALNVALEKMVRGWRPAVAEELAELGEGSRASILASRYADCFPENYRTTYGQAEAARDIVRLVQLEKGGTRSARLYQLGSDPANQLRLKIYHLHGPLPLSDAVPMLENFGFHVLEEMPTPLDNGKLGYIHDFQLRFADAAAIPALIARAPDIEAAINAVLEGQAENDLFNRLITRAGIGMQATIWFRSWFRYLRQTGLSYGQETVVDALSEAPEATQLLIALFIARHDPGFAGDRASESERMTAALIQALAQVDGVDDDRILRLFQSVVASVLRTNAFAAQAAEALAYKIDSAMIPDLPAPVPWREIFVYSPRVEGIHLRAGPVARGGLRWSDRRDDFRTEILGLMKAQRVKNAVIVPTGAKGGFFAKQLPDSANREAFYAEGEAAYRIFIRTLLSITDNIVDDRVVHPDQVVIHDGEDPYFVVAADKGTASFSDIANSIAEERGFWLGDAFASGGSFGYDHKAMGITARGAWVSVQRHFAEMGTDIQTQPVDVIGIGDMSGDVFGNGMLLSRAIRLVAAFDHRHIFIDPDPDPAASWEERQRLFALPRSSWDDYDRARLSTGAMIVPRQQKSVDVTAEAAALLGIAPGAMTPIALLRAILQAPADLLWFGGIGTYVKGPQENHVEVGDPANDLLRIDASELRVKVIGEGANLGITQAGRIAFALGGGRCNADFIDNSAGVDCSDNEVNIKIPLNRKLRDGSLPLAERNALLSAMTDDVAQLVLEDNRQQALALSVAQMGAGKTLLSHLRMIDQFVADGRLNRRVEGLADNEEYLRRHGATQAGLTRPELAVLLATAKLALQDAIEHDPMTHDALLGTALLTAFPPAMHSAHAEAIASHRLRPQIMATKLANQIINRLGIVHPFELAEEEGVALGEVARAFVVAAHLLDVPALWRMVAERAMEENARLLLLDRIAIMLRSHMADLLRTDLLAGELQAGVELLAPGFADLRAGGDALLGAAGRQQAEAQIAALVDRGIARDIAEAVAVIYKMDGAHGIALLATRRGLAASTVAKSFTALGAQLRLDWAQMTAQRINPSDPWDRLLVSGLARDFQQMRLDFLARAGERELDAFVTQWAADNAARIAQFTRVVASAQNSARPSVSMLAQIAGQARNLLGR